MLNQKQFVEVTKSNAYSKHSLTGNFIKSQLYFLVLLTVTTGGMALSNMMTPALLPPAQALPGIATIVRILGGEVVSGTIKIPFGQSLQWVCKGGVYGTGVHKVEIIQAGKKWVRHVNYDGTLSKPLKLPRGTYQHIVDGKPAPDIVVE